MQVETIKYGVVGFSKNQFDKKAAYQLVDKLFEDLKSEHPHQFIEIVSGYTNSGIPKIAYELADKHGFITVGYSAKQALKVRSGVYPVKKVILKGELFGDESTDFINYIDRLIRVGGGPQSRKETEMFRLKHQKNDLDKLLLEYEVAWYG
ncbi:hypothetical protein AAG747_12730 [Rapidithrix thailandica]|uniref:Uncharacterized protein n=1 Tax=Rapidithrix thailandica TaxID=413964 RepID=A0AAW9SBT7_9BACT